MRFVITAAQLKKLAQRLNSFTPAVPLWQLLEAIARGCGYNSWHEVCHAPEPGGAQVPISPHRVDDESFCELEKTLLRQLAAAFAQAPFGATFLMLRDTVSFAEVVAGSA